jgi:hypothetical protein
MDRYLHDSSFDSAKPSYTQGIRGVSNAPDCDPTTFYLQTEDSAVPSDVSPIRTSGSNRMNAITIA